MVNSKKVQATALPLPKKKNEKSPPPKKVPVVEETKGSSYGKGKGKIVVSDIACISVLLCFAISRSIVQVRRQKSL